MRIARMMNISIKALIEEGELEAAEALQALPPDVLTDIPALKKELKKLESTSNRALAWEAKYLRISLN